MEYKSALLTVTLFLIFSVAALGDQSPTVENFSNYVNSPEGSSGTSTDKIVMPQPAPNEGSRKNSEEKDAKPVLQGIPAKWRTCAVDSDCTAAVVDCVSWETVNKKYLKKLSGNLKSCSASVDPGFQPVVVCAKKICETTEKTTDVSWEEWLKAVK